MRAYPHLTESNAQFSTAMWRVYTRWAELRGAGSVVVYHMGKVGASALVNSLHAHNPRLQIYQVHTLTRKGITEAEAIYRVMGQNTGQTMTARARHLLRSRDLRKRMQRLLYGQKWKVITLVREPIARNIASFLQTIDYPLPNFRARYCAGELDLATVRKIFLQQFDHGHVLRWFDEELQRALGINVFLSGFPKEKGYQIYTGERCELLLIKREKLKECAATALAEFLGIQDFSPAAAAMTGERELGDLDYNLDQNLERDLYRDFCSGLQLPQRYVNALYDSQYMQHFYSQAEITAFTAKWRIPYGVVAAAS